MPTQRIGVVSLPHLAQALAGGGYDVVTGNSFAEAAKQVRASMSTGAFPVIVGDNHDTHTSAPVWLKSVARQAPVVVVATDGATGALDVDGVRAVRRAPAVVGEILVEADLPFPDEGMFDLTVETGGSLSSGHSGQAAVADQQPAQAGQNADDPWAAAPVAGQSETASPQHAGFQDTTQLAAPGGDLDPFAGEHTPPASTAAEPQPHRPATPAGGVPSGEEAFTFDEPVTPPAPEPASSTGPAAASGEEEFTFDEPTPTPKPVPAPEPQPVPTQQRPPEPVATAPLAQPDMQEQTGGQGTAFFADPAGVAGSLDELFDAQPAAGPSAPRGHRLADVVVVMSAKGGVGKSTVSLNLAQHAAAMGPEKYRVVLVDANRGQGDLRTHLRLHTFTTRTIYDAAQSGNPAEALLTPADIASYRDARWGEANFSFVPAPPSSLADPEVVTAGVYSEVIDYARSVADLVIVDTQIAEEHDTTRLWQHTLLPLLQKDAWCLAVTEPSSASARNMVDRLSFFDKQGVGRTRMMTLINMVHDNQVDLAEGLAAKLSAIGACLGWVMDDASIRANSSLGKFNDASPTLAPALATALGHVTGLAEFDPARHEEAPPGGFFSRLMARARKR